MGRSVFIEDSIEQNILKLYGVTTWATGILIGQSSSQRDYVVHLALTPPREKSNDSGEIESCEKASLQQSSQTIVGVLDEDWFVEHCRQVNRMLTGGLKILGIFVFGPPGERNRVQIKVRQVLYLMNKKILSDIPLNKLNLDCGSNEQVILQVCSATRKITCFTIDVSDTKATVHPADLKYQNFVSKWSSLRCSVCLQLKFPFEKKSKSRNLYSSLKAGLLPTLSKVSNSIGTINNVLMCDQQVLVQERQKKVSEKNAAITKKDLDVKLYIPEEDFEPVIERKSASSQVLLDGTLECQACVHPKATVKEAVDAIKFDVIRNLITRCQLLCEDFDEGTLQDESDDEGIVTWTLPKRIFAPICGGSLNVSDCIFKDEEPKDVLNRLSELLGVSVSKEDLKSGEQFLDGDSCRDLLQDAEFHMNQNITKNGGAKRQNEPVNYNIVGAVVGAITVVVAASIKFFWGDS